MIALVTGAAGFIGSTLVDRLLGDGYQVRGVDNFTDYYDPRQKRSNVAAALRSPRFVLIERDLLETDLEPLFEDVDVVFHLAAQAGVRRSWREFDTYLQANVAITQRLLEHSRSVPGLRRFVYASSSSVYGDSPRYPTTEAEATHPRSPYGVTKLAGEHLCSTYAHNWGVPTTSLRYFTVYGPRQRPDMAFHRLCMSALIGTPFPLYGDGLARRNFTYVDDVVRATAFAGVADCAPGVILNVAGVEDIELGEVIATVARIAGRAPVLEHKPHQAGDVLRTGGSIDLASELLGWTPEVRLSDGLTHQLEWHRKVLEESAPGN